MNDIRRADAFHTHNDISTVCKRSVSEGVYSKWCVYKLANKYELATQNRLCVSASERVYNLHAL